MKKQIVVLDYGFGNVRSAQKSLQSLGADVDISNDYQKCLNADALVIPGVGAFKSCMQGLIKVKAEEIVDKRLVANRHILGICVGMQVLFDEGNEHGEKTKGLAQWPGLVEQLKSPVLPHMGWNDIQVGTGSNLFKGIENQKFYFVHSFASKDIDFKQSQKIELPIKHFAVYGDKFLAAAENGPLNATQFHPEKSGDAGMQLLKNWMESI
mgnify:FL=1